MQMGSPDWNASMVDIRFRNLLWGYCPGQARVKGNDRADRLVGEDYWLESRKSQVLRNLRHYLRTQSQVHHTIDRPKKTGVEKEAALDDLP